MSGAVSGLALAAAVVLLPRVGVATSEYGSAADMRKMAVVCLGLPLVFLAIFAGEVIYTGLASYAPWGDEEARMAGARR